MTGTNAVDRDSDAHAPENTKRKAPVCGLSCGVRCAWVCAQAAVDESIGKLVASLKQAQLWRNTLLVFSSDNGGPADHANNWPLRGHKATDFEARPSPSLRFTVPNSPPYGARQLLGTVSSVS